MPSVPAFDFFVLYVSDLEASLKYFKETLGLSHVPEQDAPNFHFFLGGKGVDFGIVQATKETPQPGTVELYFKTDNLEGLRATYIGKGLEATPISHRPFGSIFTLQGPDAERLTMMS